jgi:glucosamine-6-phosphate deaminase
MAEYHAHKDRKGIFIKLVFKDMPISSSHKDLLVTSKTDFLNPIFKFLVCFSLITSFLFGKDLLSTRIDPVEEKFLHQSHRKLKYDGENIPIIVSENLYSLGKLTALHFINWIKENPEGVISLPSGKTPEYFIKYLNYYKKHWNEERVQNELKKFGVESEKFPETSNLRFVQIDEFFPIDTTRKSSSTYFINKYYVKLFELKKENILTMEDSLVPILKKYGIDKVFPNNKIDLNLLSNEEKSSKNYLQQESLREISTYCENYEKQIKKWGGIGFFLETIGPGGHISFNQKGCLHSCQTRLVKLNYKTAAVYATNLGGIENSSEKYAITLGLDTLCINKNAEIIIIAAGEHKGHIVAKAVESLKSRDLPATAFHKMRGAKFYITKGCEKYLNNRKHIDYLNKKELPISFIQDTLIEISLLKQKPIFNLTAKDIKATPAGAFLISRMKNHLKEIKLNTQKMLIQKVENKILLKNGTTILHTSPHFTDVFLSYFPLANKLIGTYQNIFCSITSSYTTVTNMFLKEHLEKIKSLKETYANELNRDFNFLFFQFKEAYNSKSGERLKYLENSLIAKKIAEIYKTASPEEFFSKLDEIIYQMDNTPPGQKNPPQIQNLKGAIRELEEERSWYLSGVPLKDLIHLQALFYTGNVFNIYPQKSDIERMRQILEKTKPDIISLALDPEGTGPDSHFKTLILITTALQLANLEKISIWGYLNVWHSFNFREANLFYLVSKEEFDILNDIYSASFSSQKKGSFPSSSYMGTLSQYAEEIEVEQLQNLKILLGENFFKKHLDKKIRNAHGLILIKEIDLQTLKTIVKDSEEITSDFHDLNI